LPDASDALPSPYTFVVAAVVVMRRKEKGEILQQLAAAGELERRGAAEKIAAIIGLSRSNIYYYLKKSRKAPVPPGSQPNLKRSVLKPRHKRPTP
jgi:DNA-binding transcriptional ArsR family regulator